MLDCGPGFSRNSQANTPASGGKIAALEPKKLTRLLLTRLHFDHTEGITEFMLSPWTLEREAVSPVYSPPGQRIWFGTSRRPRRKTLNLQMLAWKRSMPRAIDWRRKTCCPVGL